MCGSIDVLNIKCQLNYKVRIKAYPVFKWLFVVYFYQQLGAAYSKPWLRSAFSCFLQVFDAKIMKNEAKLVGKTGENTFSGTKLIKSIF